MADHGRRPLPLPVLLVTGALGAGKTCLINAMLRADHGRALAVIVNDFGAINIDAALLSGTSQPVYGLKNGCICCSLQGDLLRTLGTILSLGGRLDAIVIEASGVSDPRGIIEALFDPVLHAAVRLDAVVTVVDAQDHDSADPLWRAQVRAADFIVLAKTAQAEPDRLAALRATLGAMQKAMVFSADEPGGLPLDVLLAQGTDREARTAAQPGDVSPVLHDTRFVRLDWSSPLAVPLARFQSVIAQLTPQLARAKGFVSFRERPGERCVFQLVGRRASLMPAPTPGIGTELVFIGRTGLFDTERANSALHALHSS